MPLISILTPLYRPSVAHLRETVRGVAEQILPPGWSLEWIVQDDGAALTQSEILDRVAALGVAARTLHPAWLAFARAAARARHSRRVRHHVR